MATEEYVPVAGDDWYQRRREDAEGRFFRQVADQAGRRGEGGSTRQAIYCFTADGRLLACKNAGQLPEVMRETLREGLRQWRRLPEERRRPGAVAVPDLGQADARFSHTPPPGGLILNVYTRILDRDEGGYRRGRCPGGDAEATAGEAAARDHLWLTAEEVKALVPDKARAGDRFPLPPAVAERLVRFHLVDNTRGEPPHWERKHIRSQEFTLTVEEATAAGVRLRLEGAALAATDPDPARAARGFDVGLLGYLRYDLTKKNFERFDVVAVGDHWGEGTYTRRARPGRAPLGIAFELAGGGRPADRVPPQGARWLPGYLGTER
jgi:hypothetical protein